MILTFNSLDSKFISSEPPPVRSHPSESDMKTKLSSVSIQPKSRGFFSCICVLLVQNFQREHFIFNFFCYSDSYLIQTTEFISSTRVGIGNFLIVERFSMGALSIWVPCISVLTFRNRRKIYFSPFLLILQTCITQPSHLRSLPKLHTKHNTSRRVLMWNTVDFVRYIRILIVRSSQKKPPVKNFSPHSNSSSFVTHKHKLHFFYHVLKWKLFGFRKIFDENFVDFAPCIGIPIFEKKLSIMLRLNIESLTSP